MTLDSKNDASVVLRPLRHPRACPPKPRRGWKPKRRLKCWDSELLGNNLKKLKTVAIVAL
jgi:hypothetical protein